MFCVTRWLYIYQNAQQVSRTITHPFFDNIITVKRVQILTSQRKLTFQTPGKKNNFKLKNFSSANHRFRVHNNHIIVILYIKFNSKI